MNLKIAQLSASCCGTEGLLLECWKYVFCIFHTKVLGPTIKAYFTVRAS